MSVDAAQPARPPHHPVVMATDLQRAQNVQLRVADAITAFAGSMPFVYIHVVVFAVWMLLVEPSPWPTLTLVSRWRRSSCRPS